MNLASPAMAPPTGITRAREKFLRRILSMTGKCRRIQLWPKPYDAAATTLYAARGRLIPFNSNSPTGSIVTAFSTFVSTRGLMRICPGLASSHSREATFDTVPIAA